MKFYEVLTSAVVLVVAILFTPAIAEASCIIYQHRNYSGASFTLLDNDRLVMTTRESTGVTISGNGESYRIRYRAPWNDHVSSFRVTEGCTLTLWEHINEGGARFRSSRSHSYVGDAWNDAASEALCTCPG